MTPSAVSNNSTNVRFPSAAAALRRWVLEHTPALALPMLAHRFLEPERRVAPLDTSTASRTFSLSRGVRVGVWGEGPLVVLVHGWSSGGAAYDGLRRELLDAGFSVACFDAPAHGGSPGDQSNAFLFAEVVTAIARSGVAVHAIVGHCLGGAAAAVAHARGVQAEALVLLSPMPSFEFALDGFTNAAKLPAAATRRFKQHMKKRFPTAVGELDLQANAPRASHVLLVHDESDPIVDVAHSRELAARWAGSELSVTRGLGHSRTLGDPTVIATITRFVASVPRAEASWLALGLARLDALSFEI